MGVRVSAPPGILESEDFRNRIHMHWFAEVMGWTCSWVTRLRKGTDGQAKQSLRSAHWTTLLTLEFRSAREQWLGTEIHNQDTLFPLWRKGQKIFGIGDDFEYLFYKDLCERRCQCWSNQKMWRCILGSLFVTIADRKASRNIHQLQQMFTRDSL
jgi:hypothetical protein